MVSKKRSKKLPNNSLDCKTRLEWDNWYDELVYPGFSKKTFYMVYARDPKTRGWVNPRQWDYTINSPASKSIALKVCKIPPYDSLSDYEKDFVGKSYHVHSERDRQMFNRSMVVIPTNISKEWRVRQEAIKQQKELSFPDPWYADREYPRIKFEMLRSGEFRRNRSKHPLLRR